MQYKYFFCKAYLHTYWFKLQIIDFKDLKHAHQTDCFKQKLNWIDSTSKEADGFLRVNAIWNPNQ